jgi:RNA polymerase sigma factor (sigma-70 family)
MTDNLGPERHRATLMPPISGPARQTHGAPQKPFAPSPRPVPFGAPGKQGPGVVSDEADFLAALPVIDDVAGQVCRRHHLSATESDEFRSDVRLHFIERNYEVLRKFEGRCALATYVNVVVQRVFLDWRNRLWGRWRPSADARRLGPTAILIERLVTRDGWTLDQALETIKVNHQIELDDVLTAFCNTLSARVPVRRMVSEDDAAEIASPGPTADDNLVKAERDFLAKRVQTALDRARQALPPMDRLILKMRFEDRAAVSDIARVLHLEQRPLYRTLERLLKTIGVAMQADGISRADIDTLFTAPPIEWEKAPDSGPLPPASATGREDRKGASWRRTR